MEVKTVKGFTTIILTTDEESELRSTIGVSNVRQIKFICDLYEQIHWAHIKEKTDTDPVMFEGWDIATTAFPDWSPPFDMPEGWKDISWRHDISPSISLNTNHKIVCWLDYEDRKSREMDNKRFWIVVDGGDEEDTLIIATEDVDAIKMMLIAMGKEMI